MLRDWAALYTGRAQTHLQLGNVKEAMSDCNWAFKVVFFNNSMKENIRSERFSRETVKVWITRASLSFQADDKSLNAHITQGKVFMATKEYDKALEMFQKAIDLKPDKRSFIEGWILFGLRRPLIEYVNV